MGEIEPHSPTSDRPSMDQLGLFRKGCVLIQGLIQTAMVYMIYRARSRARMCRCRPRHTEPGGFDHPQQVLSPAHFRTRLTGVRNDRIDVFQIASSSRVAAQVQDYRFTVRTARA